MNVHKARIYKIFYLLLRGFLGFACLAGLIWLFVAWTLVMERLGNLFALCPSCRLVDVWSIFFLLGGSFVAGLCMALFPPKKKIFFVIAVGCLLVNVLFLGGSIDFYYSPAGYNYAGSMLYEYKGNFLSTLVYGSATLLFMCLGWIIERAEKNKKRRFYFRSTAKEIWIK